MPVRAGQGNLKLFCRISDVRIDNRVVAGVAIMIEVGRFVWASSAGAATKGTARRALSWWRLCRYSLRTARGAVPLAPNYGLVAVAAHDMSIGCRRRARQNEGSGVLPLVKSIFDLDGIQVAIRRAQGFEAIKSTMNDLDELGRQKRPFQVAGLPVVTPQLGLFQI
jgi:hypothetical protein